MPHHPHPCLSSPRAITAGDLPEWRQVCLHDERRLSATRQRGTSQPKSSCHRRPGLSETLTGLSATMVAWDSQVSSGNYWKVSITPYEGVVKAIHHRLPQSVAPV